MKNDGYVVVIRYRNYKDIEAEHRIQPRRIFFGKNEYYHERQWIMEAWHVDKEATRTYAMDRILTWVRP